MPEERIVNRVSQPAQDGAPKVSPVTGVWNSNPDWNEPALVEVKPENTVTEQSPTQTLPNTNVKADLKEVIDQVLKFGEAPVLLARDPDLAGFKKQVIAAFKHFGLDTRQFFGV